MNTSLSSTGAGLSFAAYISDISAHHSKFRSLTLPNPEEENSNYPQLPIAELAVLIHKLWIRGPCFTVPPSTHIGSGAQFVVRQGSIGFFDNPSSGLCTVALKTPKFVLDAKSRLNLSESAVRRQVRDFLIEVAALRHPKLRRHENIVRVIGWGIDDDNWHRTPFIALELADDDLGAILSSKGAISLPTKSNIINDIAAALDVIHEIGLIHGDLKPENILVFKRGIRWTAKLSDFGSGADLSKGGELAGRGTIGWRAPELRRHYEEGEALDPLFLDRLDAYSFGLVTLALMCEFNTSLEEVVLDTALINIKNQKDMTLKFAQVYENLLRLCLCNNAQYRPQWMLPLLSEERKVEETNVEFSADLSQLVFHDTSVEAEDEDEVSSTSSSGSSVLSSEYEHWNWELPDLEFELLHPLMFAFLEDEESLSPETAFAVFLKWVEGGPGPTDEPTASAPWARLLHAAAVGGVQQARALIFRYYEFQGYEVNDDIKSKVVDWPIESIATGALVFANDARAMDCLRFDAALKQFQESGGFNQHYSDMSPQVLQECLSPSPSIPFSSECLHEPLNRWGDRLPHILASFNNVEAIDALKSIITRECVNMRNNAGETPLYRACECGAFETVIFLLDLGANPSLRPHRKGPSCLHWLFAFHPDHIDLVARKLIEKGASTDVLTDQRTKMFHYPFMLPTGSPLHWAVRLGCFEAVRTLLSHGADPFLRDNDRQFIFVSTDPDTRPETPDDVPHEEFILGPSAGSSAVDLAVQNWNADMLELLLENCSGIPGTVTDGIGVPHHLIAGDFCWISDCSPSRFYTPYVRGTLEAQGNMLKCTLQTLCQHGFEIDSLAVAWRSGKTSTVLMLAVYAGKIDLVEMLLEAGADVNIADSDGRTALMYMGVRYGVEYSGDAGGQEAFQTRMTNLLLDHGANTSARDRQGYSPVLVLAGHYLCAAVRVLLENGALANDAVTYSNPNRDDVADFPVFGHLAWALSTKLDEDAENARQAHDEEMASMLRAHVVPLLREGLDRAVRREFDRHTLLHELAICALIESATVLLAAGAEVNPVTRRPGKTPRTPLDALLNSMDSPVNKGTRGMSKADAEKRDCRYERMVGLLRQYGAQRAHELEGRELE